MYIHISKVKFSFSVAKSRVLVRFLRSTMFFCCRCIQQQQQQLDVMRSLMAAASDSAVLDTPDTLLFIN